MRNRRAGVIVTPVVAGTRLSIIARPWWAHHWPVNGVPTPAAPPDTAGGFGLAPFGIAPFGA